MNLNRKLALLFIDVFLINFSYLVAFQLIKGRYTLDYVPSFFVYGIIITSVYIICFHIFKLYESLWTQAGTDEFLLALQGGVVGGVFAIILSIVNRRMIPINVTIIAVVLIIFSTISLRISFRIYRRVLMGLQKTNTKNLKNVLIIGAGSAGTMVLKEIKGKEELSKKVIGFIDDDKRKIGQRLYGVKVLGDRNAIEEIVEKYSVKTIIFAMPSIDSEERRNIMNICKNTSCKLKTIPNIYEILNGQVNISQIKDVEVDDLLGRDQIKLDSESIFHYVNDKVVLVTGGGGSIGSELCRQIAAFKPRKLIMLDIYENNVYDIQNELLANFKELSLEVLIASVREKKRINEIFEKYKPEIVFHAAAHKHVPLMEKSPGEAIKNNVFGTLNVAEASSKNNVERFVLISTDKAVNPTNVMGASKRLCEMIVQAINKDSKTEFVAVRFGNVLGSNGSVIPLFKKQIVKGGPVTVTSKEINRFFMTIPEAAQLVLQAGAFAKGGEIFILDMGKPVKIYDLACDLIRLSGFEPEKDIKIIVTGLRPGEKLYEELLMDEEGLEETPHKKIKIGRSMEFDLGELKRDLEEMKFLIEHNNESKLIGKLKEVVPTYKTVVRDKELEESEESAITIEK